MSDSKYPTIKIKSGADCLDAKVYINDHDVTAGITCIKTIVDAGELTRVHIEYLANVDVEVVAPPEAYTTINGEKYRLIKI